MTSTKDMNTCNTKDYEMEGSFGSLMKMGLGNEDEGYGKRGKWENDIGSQTV